MKGGIDSDYIDNVQDDIVDVIAACSLCIKIFRWSFIVFFLSYSSTFSLESLELQIILLTFYKLLIWYTPN